MVRDVEAMLKTDVEAIAPLIVTDAGETPQLMGSVPPAGLVVTAQDRLTTPVNPFRGVTMRFEVLPMAAPAVSVIGALFESVIPGAAAMVTVLVVLAVTVPVASSLPLIVTT